MGKVSRRDRDSVAQFENIDGVDASRGGRGVRWIGIVRWKGNFVPQNTGKEIEFF